MAEPWRVRLWNEDAILADLKYQFSVTNPAILFEFRNAIQTKADARVREILR